MSINENVPMVPHSESLWGGGQGSFWKVPKLVYFYCCAASLSHSKSTTEIIGKLSLCIFFTQHLIGFIGSIHYQPDQMFEILSKGYNQTVHAPSNPALQNLCIPAKLFHVFNFPVFHLWGVQI